MASFIPKPAEVSLEDANIDWATTFVLVSCDDSTTGFAVPKAASKLSPFLQPLLEETEKAVVPVKALAHDTLQNLAWYLTHFAGDEEPRAPKLQRPFPDDHFSEGQLTAFEKHYADTLFPKVGETNMKVLTGLLHGAQFVQVQPLLDMVGCALTFHFRGKTPDEMYTMMEGQAPEYTKPPQ